MDRIFEAGDATDDGVIDVVVDLAGDSVFEERFWCFDFGDFVPLDGNVKNDIFPLDIAGDLVLDLVLYDGDAALDPLNSLD